MANFDVKSIERHNDVGGIYIPNFIFAMLQIFQLLMLYALTNQNTSVESLCSYAIFGFGMLLFVFSVFLKGYIEKGEVFLFAFMFYLVVTFYIFETRQIIFPFLLQYILMLTVWSSARIVKLTDTLIRFLHFCVFLQVVLLTSLYFSPQAYAAFVDGTDVSDLLTLGFSNPNQTGIVLCNLIGNLLILIKFSKNKFVKTIYSISIIILCYFLFLCDARTSIFTTFFILGYYIFFRRRNNKSRPHYVMIFLIFISSLIFLYIYLYMYNNEIWADLEIFGKKLFSGREQIYSREFERWTNTWFGDMNRFYFRNSHNAMLTILINTGVIGLLFYIIHTFSNIKKIYDKYCLNTSNIGFIIIMSLFVNACAESSGLVSGTIYFNNMLLVCVLAEKEFDEKGA